jgi:ankyrin repeat protein
MPVDQRKEIGMNAFRTFTHGVLFVGLAVLAAPALARTSAGALEPAQGKLGQDLFMAVNRGDHASVQSLLKRGADPDARNAIGLTPLFIAAASGQTQVIETLLHAGAKLDAPSPFGTALTFAAMAGNTPATKLLLARGADLNPFRPDGITVLMMAARTGNVEIISELLRRKTAIDTKDNDGATALIHAARQGHEAVGRLLLESGAAVDAVDSRRWTALMYAAVNGHTGFVRLLLEKGANVNAREVRGRTPLLLAVTSSDYPAVVRVLLDAGADPRAGGAGNRTALTLATARGHEESARLLRGHVTSPSLAGALGTERSPNQAVHASLKLIQRSVVEFTKRTGCVSCHHEGLGRMATGAAREHGFAIDAKLTRPQLERIRAVVSESRPLHQQALKDPEAMKQVPLIEIGEVPPSYGFILAAMAAEKQPANEGTAAMAMVLARQQSSDGAWRFILRRVPMQSSFFTMTALALQGLRTYGPRAHAAELAERIRRAKGWLLTAPPETSEDRSLRLLGLKWAGATREERQAAIEALRIEQRPDGGWSQTASLQSDAYATGQALYALHIGGGAPVTDPVYQRGVQFLLRTQEADGSWFVNKRAIPLNNYFDAAFPHGQSQYASFNATCWATMALLPTTIPPQPDRQRVAK